MQLSIYHNPRCSKSRKTLSLLTERGLEPRIILYLETPPKRDELLHILDMLDLSPLQLMRRNQPEFRQLGLDTSTASDDELIDAMLTHPILIERPIVVVGRSARIGRPPEAVLEIL